ncbi:MAG: hypothetical protein IPM24_15845 [Bryobacterales bacterium]|nr:hypothetical protein [Bryobacterales bacterium]
MDPGFLKTASNVVLAVGIVLTAIGTFGAYYFSSQIEASRDAAEVARRKDDQIARDQLNEQVGRLVAGNDELRERLTPFEALARERYPGLDEPEALERLQNELSTVSKRAEALEQKVQAANPVLQPIRTAAATVTIEIESTEAVSTRYMDRGGLFALARGDKALLMVAGRRSYSSAAW